MAKEGRSQTIHFNSHGFCDINRSPAKPSGVYRIAVLGDSSIEAPQVAVADRVLRNQRPDAAAIREQRPRGPVDGEADAVGLHVVSPQHALLARRRRVMT